MQMQRRRALVTVLTWLMATAGPVRADGPAFLVKDINTTQAVREPVEDEPSSNPHDFTVLDGVVYFVAADVFDSYGEGPNGVELWRSDGTPGGTALVKDIWPGPGSSQPTGLQVFAGALYFLGSDGDRGVSLWRSDGSAIGTERVGTTGLDGNPAGLVRLGSDWLALISDQDGTALWRIDGDSGAFERVALVSPIPNRPQPSDVRLTAGERVAYFVISDERHGIELWHSDGTAAGTAVVADINPGPSASWPHDLLVQGDSVLFAADDGVHGEALWRADERGATLVADVAPGDQHAFLVGLTSLDGTVIFAATDSSSETAALWRTDGTADGTQRIAAIPPVIDPARPFIPFGGMLYFGAGAKTAELWRTDGTAAGTARVRRFASPRNYYIVPTLADAGDHLMFLLGTNSGVELWRSDGSASGTLRLRTFAWITDRFGGPFEGAVTGDGTFVFGADDGSGVEPWRSDGTAEGTAQLAEISPGATDLFNEYDGLYQSFTDLAGTLAFLADDRQGSGYLWKSDGTESGTVSVADVVPAPNFLPRLLAVGQRLYFMAASPEAGQELWELPALGEPPRLLADIYPGPFGSLPTLLGNLDGELIIAADDGVHGTELWAPYGDGLVADIAPGPDSSWPSEPVLLNGRLYFLAARALWRTDGTAEGTERIAGVHAGTDAKMIGGADRLAILTSNAGTAELWYSDGSPAGTAQVGLFDLPPAQDDLYDVAWPRLLAFEGRTLLFNASDPAHGVELWRSDGTAAGTALLADINPGPASSTPEAAASRGDTVLLFADDGANGLEPWISNGSAAGTMLVADVQAGPLGSRTRNDEPPTVIGNLFLFAASDGAHGLELWRSDATAARTVPVQDIAPDTRSSSPSHFTQSGAHLFFTANDNQHSRELWAVPLAEVGCTQNCPDPNAPTPTPRRTPRPIWTPVQPPPTFTPTASPTTASGSPQHSGGGDGCQVGAERGSRSAWAWLPLVLLLFLKLGGRGSRRASSSR